MLSLTAIMGYFSALSRSMALRRMIPVVVSSQPQMICGMSSVWFGWISETRSQPSSMVMCGFVAMT